MFFASQKIREIHYVAAGVPRIGIAFGGCRVRRTFSPPDAWPVARGTASACGVAGGTLPDRPQLLWTFTVENQGFQAGAAISGGSVYVGSTSGTLYALDLATGKKRWEFAGKSSYKTAPAVRDGRVYLGDQDGRVCLF